MPYDLVKETGTWANGEYSDSYPRILEKLGVPADYVQPVLDMKVPVEVTVSGDTFTYKMTEFGETSVNTFTLGVEGEEKDSSGSRKVIHTMEGDSMVSHYPNYDGTGLVFTTKRYFLDDNTIRTEMKCGDLEGWLDSKRV